MTPGVSLAAMLAVGSMGDQQQQEARGRRHEMASAPAAVVAPDTAVGRTAGAPETLGMAAGGEAGATDGRAVAADWLPER